MIFPEMTAWGAGYLVAWLLGYLATWLSGCREVVREEKIFKKFGAQSVLRRG